MTQTNDKSRRPQKTAMILTLVVGVIATAVAYLSTRDNPQAPPSPPSAESGAVPVQTIALPHDDPELPPGPDQREFATACTICHSTRLVMTQPPFARQQWTEVVRKMVKTYGAPITPDSEEQIVDYLTTVRGK
jgi:cytochrome c5